MTSINMSGIPDFSTSEVLVLAKRIFGRAGVVRSLPSYRDQNFWIEAGPDQGVVLKIVNAEEPLEVIRLQQAAMQRAVQAGLPCPEIITTRSGELWSRATKNGLHYWIWCMSHMPGKPIASLSYHSKTLLFEWGCTLGALDRALESLDVAFMNQKAEWNLSHAASVIADKRGYVTDIHTKEWIEHVLKQYAAIPQEVWAGLRQSTIHNDANDYNLLINPAGFSTIEGEQISAVLDFGDMVKAHTINELAIAAAYACLDKAYPLQVIGEVARGYHAMNPLSEEELSVLFVLVCMRLCVSICMAAKEQALRPSEAYIGVSQAPIRRTLPRLVSINMKTATAVLRVACGYPASPKKSKVKAYLATQVAQTRRIPVVSGLEPDDALVIDLGVDSHLVAGDPAQNEAVALGSRIAAEMQKHNKRVAVGRYNEPRLLYNVSFFKTGTRLTDESRTIHLGMDFFAPVGTMVFAPLAGTLHAIAFNPLPQDYGGVVLLKHLTPEGEAFYTLYGHLSKASLLDKKVGQEVSPGDPLGELGSEAENVGWPPHLHFQVMVDDLGLGTDFPGVALASERNVWTELSPDPNEICGIAPKCFPPEKGSKADTWSKRRLRLGPNLSLGYDEPIKALRGWKQYLFDETGRRYIDGYNNVPHVGHAHPRVVEAAGRQMSILNTNTRYLHDAILEYAEALCKTLPASLSVCYFLNSASEANELALRMARVTTRQKDMMVLDAAYHGHTTSLIDISPYKHNGPGGSGPPDWVHTLPLPDLFRGVYKAEDVLAGEKYAQAVYAKIAELNAIGRGVCGFIAETCPSVGGQLFLPKGYLSTVYRAIREAGGVCIADEVQTGLGRIGTHFWAFEAHGVVPDMVIMGKPLGNGHPIGALVTTPEIATAFHNGMEFFSTFGGNPVSCVVGREVLKVVQEENWMAHAKLVGDRLWEQLRTLQSGFPIIGDVRGSGLFGGVELVRDELLTPADREAQYVVNRMRAHGILIGTDGPFHNVVKIRPPMPFDQSNADLLVDRLGQILHELDSVRP
ncbi:MAG: aminotransferase class III-fold pyridoxal phosphate-dependent enzyme [Bacteroidetes Order II. Incertae sedis bacterium]|nr:aminotransferase class III-fold pyridoxal phosphate-dependent enzyme [Bacteroidetes Order II. bacterium]